ncbi:hypothetical protein [Synechococcus sp. CCY9202]|uniref:hypothetical protein n=1 Tax=Synechococcus sp. CCY9202 TaxID=174698 RepID=UPI002B20E873|nr:hypothetical protein [Synechococcus sp. CCY9202]MEA5423754.1 hypothetical protein [Synechococcus sp. CCY9202]
MKGRDWFDLDATGRQPLAIWSPEYFQQLGRRSKTQQEMTSRLRWVPLQKTQALC